MKILPKAARRYLRKRSREQIAYGLQRWRPAREESLKVVIFAQGRSGSALLESLLASTGRFPHNGELLDTVSCEIRHPRRYIEGLARWGRYLVHDNFLFHVKIYQLTQDRDEPIDPRTFLRELRADGWRIIYLKRENVVRQALSNMFAEHSGVYHRFGNDERSNTLTVDCDDLLRRVEQRIEYGREEARVLDGLAYHSVLYEKDLESAEAHQATVDAILDYLSLPRAPVHTSYTKVVRDLADRIANYDQVCDRLAEHGYGHYLE